MSTKPTLRLDEQLIAAAKYCARAHDRSTSVNSSYIAARLRGILKGAPTTEETNHQAHLAAKHQ